ncbi:Predicted nucleic-acid-binding protein, contains PIN domain [Bosea sp. CRIB-10]|uniref:type II toxin-antitoxin system VapC family toxin n=1 Tax=Bosea sp. CRIB-10 TaxID=378404 RepID=UPI0008EA2D98|nr:type II toxin-antitoxin system VapC family toxin [Bosea sp. CRIB-10]SFD18287.1 Predicted nucleic-acid-binding protein, contains PIN domain [Bosea sp. CRIB-10]
MIALDTNIVVRLITEDDPDAVVRARALILERSGFVQSTVLLETEWVLRAVYGFKKSQIVEALRVLGETDAIELEDGARLDAILGAYEDGLDFGDAIHLATCPVAAFASFDRALLTNAKHTFPELTVVSP